jgi:predicted ATP-dependent endonuclease of OLD family
MRITALRAEGYRNLNGTYGLPAPLAVIVGENNAGKSNLIDALRTVLEPENPPTGVAGSARRILPTMARGSAWATSCC